MKVFVTGGTGYVGQVVVRTCMSRGHEVTVLVRPDSKRASLAGLGRTAVGDLFDQDFLTRVVSGHDAVIHLVGIIREHRRTHATMDHVHYEGTVSVVAAAAQARVTRFLHMSALGAGPSAKSTYHRSKWRAEEAVRLSGLEYTIFRPSVVFGAGGPGPNLVSQLSKLVVSSPVVPVLGDGNALLQPVSVNTVAAAFCNALDRGESIGRTYELGGVEVIAYADILRRIAIARKRAFRPIHVPLALIKGMAVLFQRVPQFPITIDQISMLEEGNVCSDPDSAYRDLALEGIPFSV